MIPWHVNCANLKILEIYKFLNMTTDIQYKFLNYTAYQFKKYQIYNKIQKSQKIFLSNKIFSKPNLKHL